MCAGPVANMLAVRFTSRRVVMVGGVTMSLGFLLTVFAPNIIYLYCSYGLLVGMLTKQRLTCAGTVRYAVYRHLFWRRYLLPPVFLMSKWRYAVQHIYGVGFANCYPADAFLKLKMHQNMFSAV